MFVGALDGRGDISRHGREKAEEFAKTRKCPALLFEAWKLAYWRKDMLGESTWRTTVYLSSIYVLTLFTSLVMYVPHSLDTFEVERNTSNHFILPSDQTLHLFPFFVRLNAFRWRQPGRLASFPEIQSAKRFGLT